MSLLLIEAPNLCRCPALIEEGLLTLTSPSVPHLLQNTVNVKLSLIKTTCWHGSLCAGHFYHFVIHCLNDIRAGLDINFRLHLNECQKFLNSSLFSWPSALVLLLILLFFIYRFLFLAWPLILITDSCFQNRGWPSKICLWFLFWNLLPFFSFSKIGAVVTFNLRLGRLPSLYWPRARHWCSA